MLEAICGGLERCREHHRLAQRPLRGVLSACWHCEIGCWQAVRSRVADAQDRGCGSLLLAASAAC